MEPNDKSADFILKILIKSRKSSKIKYEEVCLIQPVKEDISPLILSQWVTSPNNQPNNINIDFPFKYDKDTKSNENKNKQVCSFCPAKRGCEITAGE